MNISLNIPRSIVVALGILGLSAVFQGAMGQVPT